MLLRLTLENWMSFRDKQVFSLIAGKERQHSARVPKPLNYQTKLLPIAALYGGNASGKTNLFRALAFAKRFITRGTLPDALIAVEPFKLDPKGAERPTRFVFELLIDEQIYELAFAVTRRQVVEERLTRIDPKSECVLYDRRDGQPHFDQTLADQPRLQFVFEGTRDNQLFLTNAISQRVETFKPVYEWFKSTLELIAPDAPYFDFERFIQESDPLSKDMSPLLSQLDTGITRLCGEALPLDSLPMPERDRAALLEKLGEDETLHLIAGNRDRFILLREDGEPKLKKLVSYHTRSDGTETKFDLRQESDGTLRLIDLLPAFLDLAASSTKKVYVIDELDRSLHTLLTRELLKGYLDACTPETRSQLLLTTHDVLLMDQSLLRRDEMWVAERDATGASTLIAFSEYKDVRYDKDLQKSYLQGRLGGIPRLLLGARSRLSKEPPHGEC